MTFKIPLNNDQQIVLEQAMLNMYRDDMPYRLLEVPEFSLDVHIVRRQSKSKKDEVRFEVCLNEAIGFGGFGEVYKSDLLVKVNSEGKINSIQPSKKAIKFFAVNSSKEQIEEYINEKNIINLQFPNMNKSSETKSRGRGHITEFTQLEGAYYGGAVIMPYITGITLSDLLKKSGSSLSYKDRLTIAGNIIKAINALHAMNLVHYDLKPDNIMVDPDTFDVQIIDFGSVKQVGSNITGPVGTSNYMAPELGSKNIQTVNVKHDYFSMAGILGELFGSSTMGRRVLFSDNVLQAIQNTAYDYSDLFDNIQAPSIEANVIITHIKNLGSQEFADRPNCLDSIVSDLFVFAQNQASGNLKQINSSELYSKGEIFNKNNLFGFKPNSKLKSSQSRILGLLDDDGLFEPTAGKSSKKKKDVSGLFSSESIFGSKKSFGFFHDESKSAFSRSGAKDLFDLDFESNESNKLKW